MPRVDELDRLVERTDSVGVALHDTRVSGHVSSVLCAPTRTTVLLLPSPGSAAEYPMLALEQHWQQAIAALVAPGDRVAVAHARAVQKII